MERAEKREFVAEMKDTLSGAGSVVVAHYAGLSVAEMTELRSNMRNAGGTVKVAKNRLVKLALEGTEAQHMADLFKGPTLIAFAEDPVAAPKAASEFAKKNDKLVILGGAMGPTHLDENGVKALATMPSLDELRAKIVGMVNTPAQRIAMLTNAPAGAVARVIGAYARKDEDA
ncbi:MAG: 50S ribosomal protein L10 [Pseudomonadota bacterium]